MQTLISFIDSFASLIIALGVLANLYFTHRTLGKVQTVQAEVATVHRATNSMKDELVREVRASSLAQGVKQGREEVQTERKE